MAGLNGRSRPLASFRESDVARGLRNSRNPRSATTANAAPARKVAEGPKLSQRPPATTLAVSIAIPLATLNAPKAVPRSSGGATVPDRRAEFRVGDAQALPLETASRDVVVSALVLNFVSDRHKALSEMKRVARAGRRQFHVDKSNAEP
jgi:SAM-dependent methyltransferase